MKKYKTVSVPLFFSREDEAVFLDKLRVKWPTLALVDGQIWLTSIPPVKSSFADCQQKYVYLWNTDVCPTLPYTPMDDGRVRGAYSGVVIQFGRSRLIGEDVLTSGDLGVGYDIADTSMSLFVKNVFRTVRSMNATRLACIDLVTRERINSGIGDYVVGAGAKRLSEAGVLLKHDAVDVYYVAETGKGEGIGSL